MVLQAKYHCSQIGGDPNSPIYYIGDRVTVQRELIFGIVSKYIYIDGLLFDMDAFEIIDIATERDEKIDKILK